MASQTSLTRYDSQHGPVLLGTLWTLSRGRQRLRCTLSTNILGWELRAIQGEDVRRSQVCRSEKNVADVSADWEAEAKGKGWGQ